MKRILIIDDEEDILVSLQNLLQKEGFEVATLSRASTAFKVIDTFKPDLILLDINLYDIDGRDICFQLKENKRTKMIKILLFSAYITKEAEYIDYKADDFIAKPIKFNDLLKKINYHLQRNLI